MTLFYILFTFLNAWFITLFITLPLCIERGNKQSSLDYEAAPQKIYWRKIIRLNTLIAACATLFLALVIESGIVQVR